MMKRISNEVRERFPYLNPSFYFVFRSYVLMLCLGIFVANVVLGFDATVNYAVTLDRSHYGRDVHLSTIFFFGLAFYVSLVNMQLGLRSLRDLRDAVWMDLFRFMAQWRNGKLVIQSVVSEGIKAHFAWGFLFSLMVALFGLFGFEMVWVPLYNYFHFEDLLWPVYAFPSTVFPVMLIRNSSMVVISFGIVYLIRGAYRIKGKRMEYRVNKAWKITVLVTIVTWGIWINPYDFVSWPDLYPNPLRPEDIHFGKNDNATGLEQNYVGPKGVLFPQTLYTFYREELRHKPYEIDDINDFYMESLIVHALNKGVKALMFISLCYPLMLRVRFDEAD